MEIKRNSYVVHFELDKRQYLPYSIIDKCPQCGEEVEVDLDEQYLMYPQIGRPYELCFCHELDNEEDLVIHEWKVSLIVDLTLKANG